MKYNETHIASCALPTVIKEGRQLFENGSVINAHCHGNTIVSEVESNGKHRAVLTTPDTTNTFQYECTCNFVHGGACEHVVAAMLAINSRDVLQEDLFIDSGSDKPDLSISLRNGIEETENIPKVDEANSEEMPATGYDEVPDGFKVDTIHPRPIGRIYLTEYGEDLNVELRCAYNTGLSHREWIEFRRNDTVSSRYIPADDDRVICVTHR